MDVLNCIGVHNYLSVFVVTVLVINTVHYIVVKHINGTRDCTSLPGHKRPLGFDPFISGKSLVDVVTEWPSVSCDFWSKYVSPGQPLLCKHCMIKDLNWKLWTDKYLWEHYGSTEVNVEVVKKEDRLEPSLLMKLEDFLSRYRQDGLYLVDALPMEALREIYLPSSLRCDSFRKSVEDVTLWLSDGGTSSVLHVDSLDNIICVLDGTKHFLLANRTVAEKVIDVTEGAYSSVDVDSVDFCRFDVLQDVRFARVEVEAGSCLFVPYMWPHQVRSSKGRNLAISFWFRHMQETEKSDNSLKNTDWSLYHALSELEHQYGSRPEHVH